MRAKLFALLAVLPLVALASCATGHDEDAAISQDADPGKKPRPHVAVSGRPVPFSQLGPGLCSNDQNEVTHTATVAVVDCTEPHTYQIVAVGDLPDGPTVAFPGQKALVEKLRTACDEKAGAFLVQGEQRFTKYILMPMDEASWKAGNRHYACGVFGAGLQPTTGSVMSASPTSG